MVYSWDDIFREKCLARQRSFEKDNGGPERFEYMFCYSFIFSTGELSTCWYVLLSGSVFIDGSMYLPTSRWVLLPSFYAEMHVLGNIVLNSN